MLRGYLGETLSARERRLVARHLNLCASARKELDRLRSGPSKTPVVPSEPPVESWDLKILRWLFKTPKPVPRPAGEGASRRSRAPKMQDQDLVSTPSPFKPIFGIILFFGGLALLTHFIQNGGENPAVKWGKRVLSKHHIFGINSSLELVLDLSALPHWSGNAAPVAIPHQELISDMDHFKIYWQILQPGVAMPPVDLSKNSLAVVFLGAKNTAGHTVKFKRAENYTDKTLLLYDEVSPAPGETAAILTRSWVLQLVPKPAQLPVVIQKIQ